MKYIALIISLLLIGSHFFLFYTTPDLFILLMVLSFVMTTILFKKDARYLLAAGLVFLTLIPFLLVINIIHVAEKIAFAAFIMCVATAVLALKELFLYEKTTN